MRKNPETILLAKIRKHIRNAISWHKMDNGMPNSWSSKDYIHARHIRNYPIDSPYYVRSDKAIEDIAKKILKEIVKYLLNEVSGEIEVMDEAFRIADFDDLDEDWLNKERKYFAELKAKQLLFKDYLDD